MTVRLSAFGSRLDEKGWVVDEGLLKEDSANFVPGAMEESVKPAATAKAHLLRSGRMLP